METGAESPAKFRDQSRTMSATALKASVIAPSDETAAAAEIVEKFLDKGSEIAIEGKLINRSYEKDGIKKFVSEVQVNELLMLGSKDPA